jgi:hypothetical protein
MRFADGAKVRKYSAGVCSREAGARPGVESGCMLPCRRLMTLTLLTVFVTTLGPALGAFGDSGHRVIGRLAELHLRDSRALEEVRRILRPNETLADASVWPDTIKNPLYEDEDTARFRLNHPGHDTYHYANLPFQADRYSLDAPGARSTDLAQVARESIRVLRGDSRTFTPREALRMLAHLAGDIHQPLHAGNAFISASGPLRFVLPEGPTGWRPTLGGNALVYGPQDRFNLHSYWDAHAVNISMGKEDVTHLRRAPLPRGAAARRLAQHRQRRRVAGAVGDRGPGAREGCARGHHPRHLPGARRSEADGTPMANRAAEGL